MALKRVEEFVKDNPGSRPKVIRSPRIVVKDGNDVEAACIKLMLYGDWGSGKTYALYFLLRMGYRVLVVATDFGGDGLNTIRIKLRKENREDLLSNLKVVNLKSYEDICAFLDHPDRYFPEIYDWNPDVLCWDGFSGFQQIDVNEMVGDIASSEESNKSDDKTRQGRLAGLQFEQQDWGVVRTATLRPANAFLSMKNEKTGKPWHKIVTCLEAVKNKVKKGPGDEGGFEEAMRPLLQGAGGVIAGAGFDAIWRCVAKQVGVGSKATMQYVYETKPAGVRVAKDRGFEFPVEIEANMFKWWPQMCEMLGAEGPPKVPEK